MDNSNNCYTEKKYLLIDEAQFFTDLYKTILDIMKFRIQNKKTYLKTSKFVNMYFVNIRSIMKDIKYTHKRTYRDFGEEGIPLKRPLILRKKKNIFQKIKEKVVSLFKR